MVFWRQRFEFIECKKMSTSSVVNANTRAAETTTVITSTSSNFPMNGGGRMIHQHPQQQQQQQVIIVPNRHKSPTKMPVTAIVGGGGGLPLYPRCSCCPFGYHIDLDFINYCQSLGKEVPSPGQKLRRDRRRQRQSMEIMLGLGPMFQQLDTLQMLPKVGETTEISTPTAITAEESNEKRRALNHSFSSPVDGGGRAQTANEKRLASTFANNALADVVQDFEKTLERSRTKSTSVEREPDADREEHEVRRRTFDSRATTRERFFTEYEQIHTKRAASLERNPSNYDNVDHMSHTMQSQNVVKDMDVESVKSCASSGSELSSGALQYIREQMASSLNKIRDLEEQNKLIPTLQRELARLKEDKRELEGHVQHLQHDKRSTRSPFSPQRVSPVQLQATAFHEMMVANERKSVTPPPPKSKLTREIGVQYVSSPMTSIATGTEKRNERNVDEKLFTETEVRRMVEEAVALATLAAKSPVLDLRSIGCQVDAPHKECVACKEHEEERKRKRKVISVPRGCQTEFRVSTASVGVSVKPDLKSVGSSDHTSKEMSCDRCNVRRRTIGCGTEAEQVVGEIVGGPVSLKLLDMAVTSRSRTDLTKSMEALMSTSQTSTSSIGTQMGNTTRDAGCQSTSVVLSNKSSQSDSVSVKGKATDTTGLVEVLDQAVNTDIDRPKMEVAVVVVDKDADREKEKLAKCKMQRTKGTNTLGVAQHEQGTNTIQVQMNEIGANTERVSQRDVGVEVEVAKQLKELPRHVTIGCENVKECVECQARIRELVTEFNVAEQLRQPAVEADILTTSEQQSQVVKAAATNTVGESRIPRPSAMSPKTQRKPMAILKRQDTYTVEDKEDKDRWVEVVEEPMVKKKTWVCGINSLKGPVPDLIGLGIHPKDDGTKEGPGAEGANLLLAAIPTSDRPMSLVQELEESESPAEDGPPPPPLPEKAVRTPAPTTTTTSNTAQSTSRRSISEDEIRKEFPDLPRKKARPTREMSGALKVINDSLMKSMDGHSLLNANTIVRREWFQVSSSETADGLDVEDYLDCFEEYSSHLLRYMVNLTDANGNTAMHYAVSHGNFDIVSILLDSKVCHVNQMNNAGYTCVMLVSLVKLIETAHRHVVQRLFQMSDVNIKAKKHNQTALMLAVSHGNLDMVQILLDAGGDINIQDEDGSTALMCAAEHGKIDIVKLLLAQADCDSSVQDVDGSTALKIALEAGYRDIGILLYAHDHMSRHRSPHSTLPRKSKLSAAVGGSSSTRYSPSASAPASPAPSKKYFDHRK